MPQPIRELPAGYRLAQHLNLFDTGVLLRLNLAGLALTALAFAVVAFWNSAIAPLREAWFPGAAAVPSEPPAVLLVLVALIVVLPLHELVHGAAIAACGYRPRFGIKLESGVLYATADQAYFRRTAYIAVALAPLVVITLAGLLGMIASAPFIAYTLGIAVIVNTGGAIGDVWFAWVLLRVPASALVRDEADGFSVFVREPQAQADPPHEPADTR